MFQEEAPKSKSDEKMLLQVKMGRSLLLPVPGSEDQDRRQVTAQPEKGLLYVVLDEMNVPHLCWKNRDTNEVDVDLMILPDETVFKRVQGNQDGKVYILKYKENRERYQEGGVFVFWLQDERADKDDDLDDKFDRELNYNSKKRLDPAGNHEEPPARVKPTAQPSTDTPSTSEAVVKTETSDESAAETAPIAAEDVKQEEPEEPNPDVSSIAEAYSASICDDAVAQASSVDSAGSANSEGVENENQRGKEKRAAASDTIEGPQGPVAKRNRPNEEQ